MYARGARMRCRAFLSDVVFNLRVTFGFWNRFSTKFLERVWLC